METTIIYHLVTLFKEDEKESSGLKLYTENRPYNFHDEAFENIEERLNDDRINNKRDIEYSDRIWNYISNGYILVLNLHLRQNCKFIIYVPEQLSTNQLELLGKIINLVTIKNYDYILAIQEGEYITEINYEDLCNKKVKKLK